MNPNLTSLQPYPFERLNRLKAGVSPPPDLAHVSLAIGEPRHPTPSLITDALISHLHGLASYPVTRGEGSLRAAVARWLERRFALPAAALDAERHVLPVNGTREALFAFAQCVIDPRGAPLVVMPNPFYQIYEGAALLAGATPHFLACTPETGFAPDFQAVRDEVWERCQLLYLCSPGNPTGAVLDRATLGSVIALADRFDFVIAADECYAEIYPDEGRPPPGLLQAAHALGRTGFERCVVFHSLSKRSNAPGLRSGFAAGDARILEQFLLYRTYHGCAMAPPVQAASTVAWGDEAHVIENRRLYRRKFAAVTEILAPVLEFEQPGGAFYLWPRTPIGDTEFARRLFAEQNVTVLPGSYLSRESDGADPGAGRVRMALVAPFEDCVDAAERIREFVQTL